MADMDAIAALDDLKIAYRGSYYTIRGAGGDLKDWIDGYDKLLIEAGIGSPKEWYIATGAEVNAFAGENRDPFPADLNLLMFPLEGLDVIKLAIYRIQQMDGWFYDIIDTMRR